MPNLKLEIEYNGQRYCGWQTQRKTKNCPRHSRTVQETLEGAIKKITREKVVLSASGRTDSGVHACAQVANFKTRSLIPPDKMLKALNAFLPDDIVVKKVRIVSDDFHSQFSSKSKIYRYFILNRPFNSALLKGKVYFFPYPLDITVMRREAGCLAGRHDFKSFCASGSAVKDTFRTIKKIQIKKFRNFLDNSGVLCIEIEADGFLYNMVRNIAGTLLEIGRRKRKQGELKRILFGRNRCLAGPTAPAEGLFLCRVKY